MAVIQGHSRTVACDSDPAPARPRRGAHSSRAPPDSRSHGPKAPEPLEPRTRRLQGIGRPGTGRGLRKPRRLVQQPGHDFHTKPAGPGRRPPLRRRQPAELLLNTSAQTALKQADGNWARVAPGLCSAPAASIADLTAAFNEHIWPSRAQASTGSKH